MRAGLIIRLCVMMLLQYFVWGMWMPFMAVQLRQAGISDSAAGWILSMMGYGSIIGPFVLAQLADRYFAVEKVMAVTHLLGGGLLLGIAFLPSFWPILLLFFVYCNLYFATVGLTNAITFRSMGDAGRQYFPMIRLFGTIGWIIAGVSLTGFFYSQRVEGFATLYETLRKPAMLDAFWVAGIASFVYGLYCFALPHTPPIPAKETDPIDKRSAVLEALGLFRSRSFTVMVALSGLVGILLAFYFQCEAVFLIDIGVVENNVPAYMTIGQVAEIFILMLVTVSVVKLGTKPTILIGLAFWGVRFGLSMIGYPKWLMISTITFHGMCFSIIVVAQMYVDKVATEDIKSSAQNVLTVVVYGIGTVLGNLVAGYMREAFGTDWTTIWAVPFVATILGAGLFALFFREERTITAPSGAEAPPEAQEAVTTPPRADAV